MYEKNLVVKPVDVAIAHHEEPIKNMTTAYIHINKDLVPGCPISIIWRWVLGMPKPAHYIPLHSHSNDEVVFRVGNDPSNPLELGAEALFTVGDEVIPMNKTSALYIPGGVPHGDVTYTRVDKPHLVMGIELGGRYD
jgi:hypothetical protein